MAAGSHELPHPHCPWSSCFSSALAESTSCLCRLQGHAVPWSTTLRSPKGWAETQPPNGKVGSPNQRAAAPAEVNPAHEPQAEEIPSRHDLGCDLIQPPHRFWCPLKCGAWGQTGSIQLSWETCLYNGGSVAGPTSSLAPLLGGIHGKKKWNGIQASSRINQEVREGPPIFRAGILDCQPERHNVFQCQPCLWVLTYITWGFS